ncbi:hypothetical protein [Flavobacterium sp. FlaQc-47]|jgi:hypothetical protein|uniref:hypothetical protein n=1 Tax=Flavobacterium sp. FlaQc-47 TaxID=3374180 RepID=UPI0037583183
MYPKNLKESAPIMLSIILENKEDNRAVRKYDYYNNYNRESKKENQQLIFGALIIFTLIASFLALLVMVILP